jgi:hypothetical protein
MRSVKVWDGSNTENRQCPVSAECMAPAVMAYQHDIQELLDSDCTLKTGLPHQMDSRSHLDYNNNSQAIKTETIIGSLKRGRAHS